MENYHLQIWKLTPNFPLWKPTGVRVMSMTYDEARAALAAKAIAEQDLARISTCPPWRHAAFAALESMLVVSPAVPIVARYAIVIAMLAGLVLIVWSDRRRLGVFINGYRRGRTRVVVVPMLIAVMALYIVSTLAVFDWQMPWLSIACAVVTFPVCYVGSIVWQRVFRSELGL